jgi:hypothetical protein
MKLVYLILATMEVADQVYLFFKERARRQRGNLTEIPTSCLSTQTLNDNRRKRR